MLNDYNVDYLAKVTQMEGYHREERISESPLALSFIA